MTFARRVAGLAWALAFSLIALHARQDWRQSSLAAFDETWQTINDSFYDPSFGGLDWSGVRAELRPRAERADSPDTVRALIVDMLDRLKQSHFVLLTTSPVGRPLAGEASVPIEVRATADGLVVTRVRGTALAASVRPGDVVAAIDGSDPMAEAAGADDRARRLDAWRRASSLLHGAMGSTARLVVVELDGTARTVDAAREHPQGEVVQMGNLPPLRVETEARDVRSPAGRRVGVIRFNVWMAPVAGPFASAIDTYRHADGLVIDLRGNPGGLAEMMRGIAGHVMTRPDLVGRMEMRGSTLEFRANPRRSTSDGRAVEPYSGPLAILVDELTASASECFAGGLQDLGRARVFGAQTTGQALPAATRPLANGDVLMYAIADFVTSTGRRLEGRGVVPDEPVTRSRAALAAGRDEPLERALARIDRQ